MTSPLLLKGFEVEMFTGRSDGTIVGCADEVARALPGFMVEPDRRNLEYATPPAADYHQQLRQLLEPRRTLRAWLRQRDLTLVPGSCLSIGDSRHFERSDPTNAYHSLIERTYGSRVVTASVHLNFGITDPDQLMAACRLMRCEGALLLALSACSPFLDGRVTGAHSQRWRQFPITPTWVPLFLHHGHYIQWMEEQLHLGTMHNVRHMWCSVRPNGGRRPHEIDRVEVRICDLLDDPLELLAVASFCELRLHQLLADPAQQDPLWASTMDADALAALADRNDQAAAQQSLAATLHHWRDGHVLTAAQWLRQSLKDVQGISESLGLESWLQPLHTILREGNLATRWLRSHGEGESIRAIVGREAMTLERHERELHQHLREETPITTRFAPTASLAALHHEPGALPILR